jgi:membrane protein implicated in regulation of membrane protease activity
VVADFIRLMRRYQRIAVLLIGGFLAFAPPGTLVFGLLLFLALVKNFWARLAVLAAALAAALWLLLRRRRRARGKTPDAEADLVERAPRES